MFSLTKRRSRASIKGVFGEVDDSTVLWCHEELDDYSEYVHSFMRIAGYYVI